MDADWRRRRSFRELRRRGGIGFRCAGRSSKTLTPALSQRERGPEKAITLARGRGCKTRSLTLGARAEGTLGLGRVEADQAVEEPGGFAGGFGVAAALLEGLEALGVDGGVGDFGVVFLEDGDKGSGDQGQVVGRGLAGFEAAAGQEVVEAESDVIPGHKEGEGFDGGVVFVGDVSQGFVGVTELVDDLGGHFGVWVEDGEVGGHGRKWSLYPGAGGPVCARAGDRGGRGAGGKWRRGKGLENLEKSRIRRPGLAAARARAWSCL
jgi:hypothetical protein